MQQSQRAVDNPALDYAISQANEMKLPLVALFVFTLEFPDANLRHYSFMLQGLAETFQALKDLNIEVIFVNGKIVETVVQASRQAALLITDKGYLRIQRSWREQIAQKIDCPMIEIEGDVLFPVEMVLEKEAYNARTIRGRIYKLLQFYDYNLTIPFNNLKCTETKYPLTIQKNAKQNKEPIVTALNEITKMNPDMDATVSPSKLYQGGHNNAVKHLRYFIDRILKSYYVKRNDPGEDFQSQLSPYLHFGQISVREILDRVIEALGISGKEFFSLVLKYKPGTHPDSKVNGAMELFEEMIIRRELSMNFCHYNEDYDQYSALPDWARTTLREHMTDSRPYRYNLKELQNAQTHDLYWNTAQMEMVKTGKMHGYMRMYWGKKLIEWCSEPEEAYAVALFLNNKFELDGRDPNSYAGIAWCFGKHDRAWSPFPILGKVRIMKDTGLNRKFDMQRYINRVKHL